MADSLNLTDVHRRAAGPSRRAVLGGAAGVGLSALLAACGTKGTARSVARTTAPDLSSSEKVVTFSNWPQYVDVSDDDESVRPTLKAFTDATGIDVAYTEDVNDNEEFFAKIRPAASNGQSIGRDLFVVSDWMSARMMRQHWVSEFDRAAMPNVAANLLPELRDVAFDPGRRFSIPWASGMTGLAYNRTLVGREIREVTDIFADDLKGKVTLFSGMKETMPLLMMGLGMDIASFSADDFATALDFLRQQVSKGQVRAFTGNDYTASLAKGQIAACFAWSGDILQLQLDNPDLQFVIPPEGAELWSDNCMLPSPLSHKANAEKLVDWYYQPEVAAELAAWVQYVSPVKGAQEAMADVDPELADNPLVFPDDETRKRLKVQRDLTEEEDRTFTQQYASVVEG
ncbi:MAG TPA: spermidine/putrescine ABC transporter substrate-binding protein [Actinomycetales bacterium]|nr:spermidine/putrescine ABC transporter substrate-binding protein [Actinomycetales bacterium]